MNIKEFVDGLVRVYKDSRNFLQANLNEETGEYDVRVCDSYTNDIHIYIGLDKIAEELNIPIQYIVRGKYDSMYPMEAFIMYEGVRFFQLVKQEGDFSV